jgi:hypothetical protein
MKRLVTTVKSQAVLRFGPFAGKAEWRKTAGKVVPCKKFSPMPHLRYPALCLTG